MSANAIILAPLPITSGMLKAGTSIPEVDTTQGEAAWVAATDYTADQRVVHGGSVWVAVKASKGVTPGTDAKTWLRFGPSNRMAPFDDQINTRARGKGSITYVIEPGFFTGIAIYGLEGATYSLAVSDGDSPPVVQRSGDLYEQAMGLFEYLFEPLRPLTKLQLQDLPLLPQGRLTLTVSNPPSGDVAIGMLVLGFWRTLIGSGEWGGLEYGASVEVKSYSTFKEYEDGTVDIVPRHGALNIRCSVAIPGDQANAAADLLLDVASKKVAFIGSNLPRYDYINTFGLVSGSIKPDNWAVSRIDLAVKGSI